MVQCRMLKTTAIALLGGTVASAAREIGVSYAAVNKWPETLPPRIADRVLAVQARKYLSADLLGDATAANDSAPAQGVAHG